MSLSDKFYEGLSAPVPIVGAQLPDDMTAYAGGPLDPLKQHKQKYKQIEYMQRLSDRESKRLLKQLEEAGDVEDMNKTSFVGSNSISRRAYLMSKLAESPYEALEGLRGLQQSIQDDSAFGVSEEPVPLSTDSLSSGIGELPASIEPQQDNQGAVSFTSQEPLAEPTSRPRDRPLSHDEKIRMIRGMQRTMQDDSAFGLENSPRASTTPDRRSEDPANIRPPAPAPAPAPAAKQPTSFMAQLDPNGRIRRDLAPVIEDVSRSLGPRPTPPAARQPTPSAARQSAAPVAKQPAAPVAKQPAAPVAKQPAAPAARQPAAPAARQPAAPAAGIQVPSNLTKAPVRYQAPEDREPAAPGSPITVRSRYVVPAVAGKPERERRFVGQGREENIGNSGQLINSLQEFNRGYRRMSKDPRMIGPTPDKPDNRGFFQRLGDGLYHYGSRAARGLSTGAQMGASYLYDAAQDGGYLDSGSFLGDKLDDYKLRGSLNDEMARINASLAHSYGYTDQEDKNDRNANLYANRLRGIDTDLTTDDIQARTDLLSREAFRKQLLNDQMSGRFTGYTDEQRKAIRESRARNIDNFYGFEGNTAGMPSIRDDITGTSFRNALNELQDGTVVNPAKEQARAAALEEMLAGNPQMATAIQEAFGAEAEKAGVPLAQFAASRLARDLNYSKQLTDAGDSKLPYDDVYETDDQRLSRYEQTRDFTNSVLESMDEKDRGNFISQMNPRVVQRAEQISSLMDNDPEEALRMVNDMDPQEARFLLDQISMLSKYVSPDMAQTALDSSRYQVREDKDDFFPSFGGTDLVNPALQQVGAGGAYSQMTGDARDRVFGFNSMQDAPASEGEFFLVDDGNLVNTYYNPTTGEVNRELFTNFGNANKALPREFYDKFYKRFGHIPNYRG